MPEQYRQLSPQYLAEDQSQSLLQVALAFLVVETAFFAAFVASRFILNNYDGIETWLFMPLGYLCCVGDCVIGILMVKIGGFGRHVPFYLATPNVLTTGLKLIVAQEFLYAASITFSKLAIVTLYLRIIQDKWTRRMVWITGAFIIVHGICTLTLTLALCRPFAYNWSLSVTNAHCGDRMAAYRFVSIPNILSDFAILLLPLQTLYRLNICTAKKAGIILTFLVGSFGIITAIIRFIHFYTENLFTDFTFIGVDNEGWTIVECGTYFLCACLPGLRPSIKWFLESKLCVRLIKRPMLRLKAHGRSVSSGTEDKRPLGAPLGQNSSITSQKASIAGSEWSEFIWKDTDRFEHLP